MINQNLLYGLLLFILAYMRINPGKNILCYIILFLIALIILYPVEGWTVSTASSNDDNKISNFVIVLTDKTLDGSSSDSGSSTPLDLKKLPAKFFKDNKIDKSKIKIELQFDYKFSTSQIEKLNAITADEFDNFTDTKNLKTYNNLLNMLMNQDNNLSGEGFQIKIAEMDGTTENNVVINHVFDDSGTLKIKSGDDFTSNITKSEIIGTFFYGNCSKKTFSIDLTEIYNSKKFTKDKKYRIFYNSQTTKSVRPKMYDADSSRHKLFFCKNEKNKTKVVLRLPILGLLSLLRNAAKRCRGHVLRQGGFTLIWTIHVHFKKVLLA